MDAVYIHRGIAVPRGTVPDAPFSFKNPSSRVGKTKGVFILPSSSNSASIDNARKRAIGWTGRYTENNPSLESLVMTFQVTKDDFELLKDRFAIYYLNGKEMPLTRFDQLAREAEEADNLGDPGITFNGEELSGDIAKRLKLEIGRKEGEDFVYKPFDELSRRIEGPVVGQEGISLK